MAHHKCRASPTNSVLFLLSLAFSVSKTMGSREDFEGCNAQLSIGLPGYGSLPDRLPSAPKPPDSASDTFPGRNIAMDRGLVLFGQCIAPWSSNDGGESNPSNNTVSPPNSTVSSFHAESNGNSPQSSHLRPEDAEEEKAASTSRLTDEEEDGGGTRKKLRLSQQQSAVLEESFKLNSTLNPREKQTLAAQLDLLPRQVEVWFQNRRARTKLKQTEQDCELLRKRCVSLTEENRKLHKEVEELRVLKLAGRAPFYIGSKSVSMCPSCQRVMKPDNPRAFGAFPNLQFYPSH